MSENYKAFVKVRCCGHLHRIAYDGKDLIFLDHPLKLARAEQALKGESAGCIKLLNNWRKGKGASLPRKLYEVWWPCGEKREIRAEQARQNAEASSYSPLRVRAKQMIRKHALDALYHADYRVARAKWAGGCHTVEAIWVDSTQHLHIKGGSQKVWGKKWSGTNSEFRVWLMPLEWWKVHKAGISTVLDPAGKLVFVLHIYEQRNDGFDVLAGRQGLGFGIIPTSGHVSKKDGKWRIKWKK